MFFDFIGFKDVCLGVFFYLEVVKYLIMWDGVFEEGLCGDGVFNVFFCL